MNLLFLTPQLPFPTHQGTTLRTFNLLKQIAPHHRTTLLTFGTSAELESAQPLIELCKRIEIVTPPHRSLLRRAFTTLTSALPDMGLRLESKEMHALIKDVLSQGEFDWIQIEGIEMARYYAESVAARARVVFDDHNAEYMLQRSAFESDVRSPVRWLGALYSLIQWRKLVRFERKVCMEVDSVVAVSRSDDKALRALDSCITPIIIPNGVDTDFYHYAPEDTNSSLLVFTGKMDFRPNIDAMLWFCRDILPILRKTFPDVRLKIVGQKPSYRVSSLAQNQGVVVTGAVEDVRPFISEAAVYVVPLRMGSGTRLKILEAMAMGKAIVSTRRGAEGIECLDGRELILADTPDEFATSIGTLLQSEARRKELGGNARRLVEEKYEWKQIVPLFESIYVQQ